VHHLIEMLEIFVPIDPRSVFLQVAALVESGRSGGYHYESMGAERIVRIVERYLAEHRPLLQENTECRIALRRTLDAFVEAGWPSAQQLSSIFGQGESNPTDPLPPRWRASAPPSAVDLVELLLGDGLPSSY